MLIYLSVIFISIILISVYNIIFTMRAFDLTAPYIVFVVFISAVIAFLIDALVAFVIHKLPKKWFNPYNKIYRVWNFERRLYENIGIKKWKDRVPEMGQLCNFKKDKIASINDNEYIFKFLQETCYAEVLHFLSAILGFAVIFVFPLKYMFYFTLPVAIVNCLLQILPIFIQRYTRPKLIKIYERNLRNLSSSSC